MSNLRASKILIALILVAMAIAACAIFLGFYGWKKVSMDPKTLAIAQTTMLNHCLEDYCRDFSPQFTTNKQIAEVLMGNNPSKEVYLLPGSLPQNSLDELVDAWGSPFIFKQENEKMTALCQHALTN